MRVKTLVVGCVASAVAAMAVGLSGCSAGSGEIPLAKVPPPPPGFGRTQEKNKHAKGGSPDDISQYTK